MEGVPGLAALVDARELRATAAAAVEAAVRVAAHRRALGDRPRLDREAAAEAMEADAATVWAKAASRRALQGAGRWLLVANAGGVAVLLARLATAAADPLVPLAGALPVAALTAGAVAVGAARHRGRVAERRRQDALGRTGVSTVAALLVRQDEVAAWDRAAAALRAAEQAAVAADRAWAGLVGPEVPPASVEEVIAAVAAADAARATAPLPAPPAPPPP
ncbi:MAG TPA: hypothetical protein VM264_02790, partial [Acidimicrobiales bacterium]|nr:hypothetical protein [Acidimicrobiales bacterium]